MKWLRNMFGGRKSQPNMATKQGKDKTRERGGGLAESAPSSLQESAGAKNAAGVSARVALDQALSTAVLNGPTLYAEDRNKALRWFEGKGFLKSMSDDIVVRVNWFISMSIKADDSALWDEVWGGFHHALAGCLELNWVDRIPEMCWHLGRAHTGLSHYELAELYLETAYTLSQQQGDHDFSCRILLEKAVVGKIAQRPESVKDTYHRAEQYLFPSYHSETSALAKGCADKLFQEGGRNHQWRKNGEPVRYCLVHATGYYEVSLDLNRRLGNRQAMAITLSNLGDVWRKLSEKEHAFRCWNEALKYLQELGDKENVSLLKRWMSEI